MLLGDIGQTALLAARRELARAELTLFRPINACWRVRSRPQKRSGRASHLSLAVMQPQLRLQWFTWKTSSTAFAPNFTAAQDRVEIFSRDLRRVTGQFDEIAERARSLEDEIILDGEIMAFEHGQEADLL